jgi:hypothetical protein
MKYFALFYDVVNDFVSRRSPFREEHLRLARVLPQTGCRQNAALASPLSPAQQLPKKKAKGFLPEGH